MQQNGPDKTRDARRRKALVHHELPLGEHEPPSSKQKKGA
jgi:hypothetical protein